MKTPGRGRRLLLKVAAWTLAVPALFAAVVAGGAVPLYLLLPNAEPAAQGVVETAQTSAPASQQPSPAASPAVAKPAEAAVPETSEAVDESPTGATAADAAPDEGEANAPAETVAATVIPTPRPDVPMADARTPVAEETREVAAVGAVPPPHETTAPAKVRPEDVRSEASMEGRRTMVRTGAKLRVAPQGAEIGVLRAGTEVIVGRCDRWCEVSADGRRGFVHASLIDDGTKRNAERSAGRRIDGRSDAGQFPDEQRVYGRRDRYDQPRYDRPDYDRRDDDREAYERAYRREEDSDWLPNDSDLPPEEPDWYVEDERPVAGGGPPALLYYEPYP